MTTTKKPTPKTPCHCCGRAVRLDADGRFVRHGHRHGAGMGGGGCQAWGKTVEEAGRLSLTLQINAIREELATPRGQARRALLLRRWRRLEEKAGLIRTLRGAR